MLKKSLFFLLISTCLSSCAIKKINYSYDFKTIQQGIDFTSQQGNWLLNTSDIPERNKKAILNKFNNWTNNKATFTDLMVDKQGKKINSLFSLPIDNKNLKFLEKVTDYKYLANIYLLKTTSSTPRVTVAEMMFDIYDISTKELIVSERVIGSMNNKSTYNIGDIKGFRITAEPIMISGLVKKGLKKIDQNSMY